MFIGRTKELKLFDNFINNNDKTLLLYGKRRVGKTRLIKEAYSNRPGFIYYECTKDTLENNANNFVSLLIANNILPKTFEGDSFITIFNVLDLLNKKLNIVIDEYPYLYEFEDKNKVDSIFQKIVDNYLNNNKLIFCGSNVKIMQSLVEENNALFGRLDTIINLKELDYLESSNFYDKKTIYDKIAFYSVFGGSPFINIKIDSNNSIEDNIKDNFLDENSQVFRYCENLLFTDVPSSINIYAICQILKNGKKTCSEIENSLKIEKNGGMNKKLDLLFKMGLINKYQPINKIGNFKSTRYEINDNAIRFFYTFIYDKKSIIQNIGKDRFYDEYIKDKLKTFISHRFEDVVKTYFSSSVKKGLYNNVIDIGTYYYDDPINKTNGEFDVAMKTNDGNYIICEVKYYQDKKMTKKEMDEEYNQIKRISELNIYKVLFVCTSGYEKNDYECIEISNLYQ